MVVSSDQIRVLHVEDELDLAEIVMTYLERGSERLAVETATSAQEGLSKLRDGGYDCIVSDYDMPGQNGIEFLKTVREGHPDLPFIMYTGKGNERIASEAISAGVTDYFQKRTGTEQFTILGNRIENAVQEYRADRAAETTE